MTCNDLLNYGHCSDCKKQLTAAYWCNNCEINIMKVNFKTWTSECILIDNFIKHTQLNSKENMDYLEWIDFDQFELVKNTNKQGAFSTIYSALWLEGPKLRLEVEESIWTRSGPTKVILKRLNNSQYMNKEYVNQLYSYHRCLQCNLLADFFGMTKDPSSCYMFVMGFYKNGNLYEYINSLFGILSWNDILDILLSISAGLNFIHVNNLFHGNLHGGNVLIEDEAEIDGIEARISDTGLNGLINEYNLTNSFFGVVPFIAPEVFNGKSLTKESDIYSFGMIMYMLSAGVKPYYNRPHNEVLIYEICSGLRPQVIEGTPPIFAELMSQCLDTNLLNRPAAYQVYETLDKWVIAIKNEAIENEMADQFYVAEEFRYNNFEPISDISHEDAIYYSRLFKNNFNVCNNFIVN